MTDVTDAPTTPSTRVLIVGGGASGLSCALFLARAGIESVVFDQGRTLLNSAWLHNVPGAEPVLGTDWLQHLRQATDATGLVTVRTARVTSLAADADGVQVDAGGEQTTGDYLVIASGQMGIPFAEPLGLQTTDPVQPYVRANIVVDQRGRTSVDRVYACGVVAGFPSQAVICAGSGANVAVQIASVVKGEFWVDHDDVPKKVASGATSATAAAG